MLNIHIDDPELEKDIRKTLGDDSRTIANAFAEFIRHRSIQQDIGISIEQLESGEAVPLADAIKDIRTKYE